MISPPTDPDIIILGYNTLYFTLAGYISIALLFIWDPRGGA